MIGIVLATILGTLIGIGRLSGNWLLARLTAFYVETLRDIPLLLQLLFWYTLRIICRRRCMHCVLATVNAACCRIGGQLGVLAFSQACGTILWNGHALAGRAPALARCLHSVCCVLPLALGAWARRCLGHA